MRHKGVLKSRVTFCIVILTACLILTGLPTNAAASVNSWREYQVRQPGGIPTAGDTLWQINGGTLIYNGVGNGSYIEDFVQSDDVFLIDNTKLEFDFRGSATTRSGYVGPVVLWAPDASERKGCNAVTSSTSVIGAQGFYRWENTGTAGVYISAGGASQDLPIAKFAGLNDGTLSHHSITVKDGKVIYESDQQGPVEVQLGTAWDPQTRMHISVGVRYYDVDVPFTAEFRNIQVTTLEDSGSNTTGNTTVNNGDIYSTAVAFLQAVDEGEYDSALTICSPRFSSENDANRLANLQAFMNEGGTGTLMGCSINETLAQPTVSLFFTNAYGEKFSIHIAFDNNKVDSVLGRWGR